MSMPPPPSSLTASGKVKSKPHKGWGQRGDRQEGKEEKGKERRYNKFINFSWYNFTEGMNTFL